MPDPRDPNPNDSLSLLQRNHTEDQPSAEFIGQLESRLLAAQAKHAGQSRHSRLHIRAWIAGSSILAACTLLLLLMLPNSSVTFAGVQQKLQEARTVRFTMRVIVGEDTASPLPIMMQSWFDQAKGVRTDLIAMDTPIIQSHLPWNADIVIIDHIGQIVRAAPAAPQIRDRLLRADPTTLLRRLREHANGQIEHLGTQTTQGIASVGFRVAGDELGLPARSSIELWVDPTSKLPRRIVAKVQADAVPIAIIADQFVWDQPIADGIFQLDVPEQYRQLPMKISSPSEQAMLQSLERFAQLTAGHYPGSKQANLQLLKMLAAVRLSQNANGSTTITNYPRGQWDTAESLLAGGAYYLYLMHDRRKPQYFGSRVTADQHDAVLLQWQLTDGRQRQILGDLTRKTIAAPTPSNH